MTLSTPLSTISLSSQQKRRPSTNIPLQICQQSSATISIPPKELITYSKIVQTNESAKQDSIAIPIQRDHSESDGEFQQSISECECIRSLKQLTLQCQTSLIKNELTNDEREQILKSEPLQDFFSSSSRLIERSLWESPQTSDNFFDERWTAHRIVTSIDTSTYYPKLVLAPYSQNEQSIHQPDEIVLIWNTKFKSKPTPEYVFHCQSWATLCMFSQFHPSILLGGTFSGQIVVSDTRINKHTALSPSSHAHPIYCLQVIGTENANNLISISNDGKMCSWNIKMMTQPQESMNLMYRTKPVVATRIAFPNNEVNHFIIGSEEGQAYFGSRYGNKTGIQGSYEGRYGPITGLSCHSINGSVDFLSFFLTSSFDWSVKLWSLNESKSETVALNKCLWSHNGQQIILQDDQGKLRLYDVKVFLTYPKQDDLNK